jgi:hypothetical protein
MMEECALAPEKTYHELGGAIRRLALPNYRIIRG